MHHDQYRISPDNKGWAARKWEEELAAAGNPDYVAAFAQATAGDVTPNYILHEGDYFRRGVSRDDEESMAFNGQLQLDHARALWQAAAQTPAIAPQLESMTAWADLSKVRIHPDYADGATYETTGPASIGVNLVLGTAEGNGIPAEVPQLVQLLAAFTGARRPETHGDRGLLMDTGGHGLLGLGGMDPDLFPAAAHPIIAEYQWLARRGMLQPRRFLPNVLPLQWVRIGPLLLLSLPGEPTTHAGRRIRQAAQTTLEALEQSGELAPGLERVIAAGYSNGFAGYITTREEYSRQLYEGGHTLFGKYTAAAYCTLYRTMVGQLARPHYERHVPFTATPQRIPWAVIDRMRWEEWTGRKA
jgi:neutral ceramidase